MPKITISNVDNPDVKQTFDLAPWRLRKVMAEHFGPAVVVKHPDTKNVCIYDPGTFAGGPIEVRNHRNGTFSYTEGGCPVTFEAENWK